MTNKCSRSLVYFGLLLMILGCSSSQPVPEIQAKVTGLSVMEQCIEPRSMKCTREYRPVCAFFKNGATSQFSNACTACSNHDVSTFRLGNCPLDKAEEEQK